MGEHEGGAPGVGPGQDEFVVLSAATLTSLRHDLRTPIHQILGYAEMLEEDAEADGNAPLGLDLGRIQSAARRLLQLVDTLELRFPAGPVPEPHGAPAGPEAAPPDAVAPPGAADVTGPIRLGPVTEAGDAPDPATVLVVDDNDLNREMLSRRLQQHGYVVSSASGGAAALAAVAAAPPDLVLLDVVMPDLSGLEVLRQIRDRHAVADLPVIMATARDDSRDIVNALQLGANDYVTKPLDFPVVLARMRTQLSLKRAKDRIASLVHDLELRNRFIFETFGRYLSNEVVESILRTPEGLSLGGESRKVTLLMSDLRGFTAMAEKIPPDRVVRLLNAYLGSMADVILGYQGTIDEFIGDAILAIFGAPVSREDDAERAVACAVAMQRAMGTVNDFNRQEGLPQVEMGIAIHTGEVIVGNIGSSRRAKYGVVGSPVNLTARIESYTVGGQVLVSEPTRRELGELLFVAGEVEVQMKGFEKPLVAYDTTGIGPPWDLHLSRREEPLSSLVGPLAVRFAVEREKRVDGPESDGLIVRLSMKEAEVESREAPPPFSNLRLRLVSRDGSKLPGDLYGKVGGRAPQNGRGFVVRFTSLPPEVRSVFEALLPRR